MSGPGADRSAPRYAAERALTRADFDVLCPVTSRWADNDMFGHLNNAVYYQMFDTAINGWLAGVANVEPLAEPVIGVVAESRCVFFGEVGFPQALTVGLRVARLGRTSVSYELGVFGDPDPALAAFGQWTHVYVDRVSRVPTEPPQAVREALRGLAGRGASLGAR